MKTVHTRTAVRAEIAALRSSGGRIALVPTMGFLHDGHLSLVDRARERADHVVMSIFVNPLQFAPDEDFQRYPRDLERDAALVQSRGVDLIFAPPTDEVYTEGEPDVQVVPGALADRLCGAFRPGHFQGVLTIVAKLFNIIQPDVAVFGRKDFQQSVLVRRMVRDLDFPVDIDVAPIVREHDGLAMSSRNAYLSPEDRARATALHVGLDAARSAFAAGERGADTLRGAVTAALNAQDIAPQYVELVDPATLDAVQRAEPGHVLAVAAFVGRTRLIDNMVME
ncbi:MAG TPA: pantoate--beta-alanine ligase [Longimicrobiales bacterium]|nr:pantoate--beta-alanine ligase [Longimicrobiales bacterium]